MEMNILIHAICGNKVLRYYIFVELTWYQVLGILSAVVSFNHTPDKHKYSLIAIGKFVP